MNAFLRYSAAAITCLLAGAVEKPAAAQSAMFGNGLGSYALLNGDNLALYVDQYGDLGAPRRAPAPSKPGGTLNPQGQPYINPDGSVDTTQPGTYAALYTDKPTNAATIGASVQKKLEYITLGNVSALEGYGIHTGAGTTFVPYTAFTNPTISATGASIGGLLTATSTADYASGSTDLGISQTISFNDAGRKNFAEFAVTFTNLSATDTISNLQYARAVNPNQDYAASASVQTSQSFGTPTIPGAFAINSTGGASGHQLGLGVVNGGPNAAGSTVYAVSGSLDENALLSDPSYLSAANSSTAYVQLLPGGGAMYVDPNNPADNGKTNDYQAYLAATLKGLNPGSAAFFESDGVTPTTPAFSTFASDTSLVLLSPSLNLAPGASTSFDFYYAFDATPEPGSLSLLAAGALGIGAFARRRLPRRAPAKSK